VSSQAAGTLRIMRGSTTNNGFWDRTATSFTDKTGIIVDQTITTGTVETVPVTLALFRLADGDPNQAIVMGANFGRDADTIATMVGGLAGALRGVDALRPDWVRKAESGAGASYRATVDRLVELLAERRDQARQYAATLDQLMASSTPEPVGA
jgi:hypothetical protein